MNTNIVTAVVLALAILGAGYFMGKKPITVTQQAGNTPIVQNSIAVQGDGKVYAKPDIFIINMGVSQSEATTEESFKKVTEGINAIKTILKDSKVEDKDIQTSQISIYPKYDYNGTKSVQDGYTASHTLTIKIRDLDSAGNILDKVSAVNGVIINNTSYDIDNKEPIYQEARKLAFEKAEKKAQELAKLANVALGKVTSISDATQTISPIYTNRQVLAMDMAGGSAEGTSISAGQLEFNLTVSVVYTIQ